MAIKPAKCMFKKQAVDFLGHRVSPAGITPLATKVAAVKRYPLPSSVKDLQRYLGILNFYRRFLPAAADTLDPLYQLLQGNTKPAARIDWTPALRDR